MAETPRRRRRIRHTPETDAPIDPGGNDERAGHGERAGNGERAGHGDRPGHGERAGNGERAGHGDRPGHGERRPAGAETTPVHDPLIESAGPLTAADDRETERGLRGLVGAGSSQVSAGAALRARDAARPTDADLAAAETDLTIVRRGWVPRDQLSR